MTELPLDLPKTPRGTRLDRDWTPTPDLVEWCQSQLGMSFSQITREAESFVDYWIAQPGQRGVKLDWPATFRNWCRKNYHKGHDGQAHPWALRIDEQGLQIIANHVRKPWFTRGHYARDRLQACVDAGYLSADEMERAL